MSIGNRGAATNIQPIRNNANLERAFARMEVLWSAEDGTLEAEELEVLAILIERYEDEHCPIDYRIEPQSWVEFEHDPPASRWAENSYVTLMNEASA